MNEACAYAHTPMEFRFCPFGFSFEVLIRCENLSKYVFMCRHWVYYTLWQTWGKGNEKKSNKSKMPQFSLTYLHFLLNLCTKRYQDGNNWHK